MIANTIKLTTLLMVLVAAVLHHANASDAKSPIRIGVSLGLTGQYAKLATDFKRGYELWANLVNQQGGILGRSVELIVRDDKSNNDIAKSIYTDFATSDEVDFILAPYSTAITSAILPVTEQYGYPLLATGASSDELWLRGYRHLFAISAPASRHTTGFLYLLSEAKITRVAIVSADDGFSMSVGDGANKWSQDYGITVVSYQKIVKGTADLTTQAETARNSGAEAIIMAGHFEESINMRKAMKKISWTPKAYFASIGPGLDSYYTTLGSDAEQAFTQSHWEVREDVQMPGAKEFIDAYAVVNKEKPSYYAARAYVAGSILEQAIKKAGTLDRKTVTETLFNLNTKTLLGRYLVDRTGAQTKSYAMIAQWQNGKREIVWPEELRTAKAIFTK